MFKSLSYVDFYEIVILYFKELNEKQRKKILDCFKRNKNYEEIDKKFLLKTTLYDVFWDIPEAVNKGFNEYLDLKLNYYYNLKEYHKVNCIKPCSLCDFLIEVMP